VYVCARVRYQSVLQYSTVIPHELTHLLLNLDIHSALEEKDVRFNITDAMPATFFIFIYCIFILFKIIEVKDFYTLHNVLLTFYIY
jgi:hypothetical protein